MRRYPAPEAEKRDDITPELKMANEMIADELSRLSTTAEQLGEERKNLQAQLAEELNKKRAEQVRMQHAMRSRQGRTLVPLSTYLELSSVSLSGGFTTVPLSASLEVLSGSLVFEWWVSCEVSG